MKTAGHVRLQIQTDVPRTPRPPAKVGVRTSCATPAKARSVRCTHAHTYTRMGMLDAHPQHNPAGLGLVSDCACLPALPRACPRTARPGRLRSGRNRRERMAKRPSRVPTGVSPCLLASLRSEHGAGATASTPSCLPRESAAPDDTCRRNRQSGPCLCSRPAPRATRRPYRTPTLPPPRHCRRWGRAGTSTPR